jgi:hypothetical protein
MPILAIGGFVVVRWVVSKRFKKLLCFLHLLRYPLLIIDVFFLGIAVIVILGVAVLILDDDGEGGTRISVITVLDLRYR